MSELRALPYPHVVLASGLDLETSSFALDLFAEWMGEARNALILTQKPRPGCLARKLYDAVITNRPVQQQAVVQMFERVPLEGRELLEHQQRERQAALEAKQKLEEEEEEDDDDDGDEPALDAGDVDMPENTLTPIRGPPDNTDADVRGEGDKAGTPRGAGATPRTPRSAGAVGGGGMWTAGTKRQKTNKVQKRSEGRYLMFPHKEEIYNFDEYGEVFDTSIFQKADEDLEIEGMTTETINFSGAATSDAPLQATAVPEKDKPEVATKSISKVVKVQIRCPVSFVDFGGRSDSASAHTILEHLKPSKVIIVHGTDEATASLRDFCIRKVTEPDNTLAPPVGEAVLASSDTNIYKIKLDSALAQALQFVKVGAYDVAYIDALIECEDTALGDKPNKDKPAATTAAATATQMPVLKLRQGDDSAGGGSKPFAFVGDVKLSDLKRLLDNAKYKTELKAGMLLVNGQIIIRKAGSRMVFEGTICKEFHTVRKLLLSQYHTL